MSIRRFPLSLVLSAISLAVSAQSPPFDAASHEREVDAFMQQQMTARQIPGAAVAVVRGGRVILVKGYGVADVEHRVPLTEHTVFELASVTKPFTAMAIMMLVQDGKLSLDARIADVMADLPAAWRAVTVRQLLTHTSGIADFARPAFNMNVRKDYKPREILQLVADAPLDFPPGERHSYSNTGYVLLGMAIETLAAKEYGVFLRERIFEPLGMSNTRYNDRRAIVANRARGYALVDYTLQNAQYVSPTLPYAAGGLVSSAADMAKWLQAQGSETFLTRAHWEQMWAPARLNDGSAANYGFGWNIRSAWSRKRVDHAGGIEGFATGVTRFIDDDLSIVFLMNLEGSSGGRIAHGLFGIYLPPTRYNPPKPIADADARTTGWLREVTSALSQGTGDPAWYTPKVQAFYFPDRIKARKLAFRALGSLQSFELIEARDERGRDKRTYRATFGTTPLLFSYWLTSAGKIDDVDFRVE